MKNKKWLDITSIIILVILIVLNLILDSTYQGFSSFINAFKTKNYLYGIITENIIPRTISCILVGAALSVSGLLLQSMLNNSLASPATLGINSGAGLMVIIYSTFINGSSFGLTIATFLGSFLSALLIYLVAKTTGASRNKLVLAGIALSRLFSALMDTILVFEPQGLVSKQAFQLGTFEGILGYKKLLFAGSLIIIGLIAAIIISRYLSVLSLGDDVASSLGMNVKKMRFIILIAASILSAGAVAIAGLLSFLGLIIPHLVRSLIGNENPKRQVKLSIILGSSLTLLCDLLSRMLFIPSQPPVGIFLSLLGIPFFIILLFKKGGNSRVVKNQEHQC